MSVIVRPIPPAGRKGPTTDLRVASTTVAHARGQPFLPQKAPRMIWALGAATRSDGGVPVFRVRATEGYKGLLI